MDGRGSVDALSHKRLFTITKPYEKIFFDPRKRAETFLNDPEQILASLGDDVAQPFLDTCMWPRGGGDVESETEDK